MFLYVFLKSSLVAVVGQQPAFVEREIAFAEGEAALVLFAHVPDHSDDEFLNASTMRAMEELVVSVILRS